MNALAPTDYLGLLEDEATADFAGGTARDGRHCSETPTGVLSGAPESDSSIPVPLQRTTPPLAPAREAAAHPVPLRPGASPISPLTHTHNLNRQTLTGSQEAEACAALCARFVQITADGLTSGNVAAAMLGKSAGWFSKNVPRWRGEGAAAFAPKLRETGSKLFPTVGRDLRSAPSGPPAARSESAPCLAELPPWFIPAAKFFNLLINRTRDGGSVPEAITRAISLPKCEAGVHARLKKLFSLHGLKQIPTCPEDLRNAILARAKAGKELLPESVTRHIAIPKLVVRQRRNPKNTRLQFLAASGTQMWMLNPETGNQEFIKSGQVIEVDDGTINFPCVVPWPMRGCPCSEIYDVKVARFQFLLTVDAGSRFVPGFSYTCRPRSSYRAEDLVATMRSVVVQHGIPEHWRMEQGVSAANLVKNAIARMDSNRWGVHSPRSKPFIEGLFNKLWSYLSLHFPDADVGRFRGETAEANRLLTACQQGHQDPRKYFPMLSDVMAALQDAIARHNASTIRSANYGSWIPNERWQRDLGERPMRRFNPANTWLFSPFVREWKVSGNAVGGKVPFLPGHSVPYEFQAAFLTEYHGAMVQAYFDPSEAKCVATIVLAQNFGTGRRGQVLGVAQQVNQTTDYIRMILGWSDGDPGAGKRALAASGRALVRMVRAIDPLGRPTHAVADTRDGLGNAMTVESEGRAGAPSPAAASSESAPYHSPFLAPSEAGEIASPQCDTGEAMQSFRQTLPPSVSGPTEARENFTQNRLEEAQKFEEENAHLFV